LIKKKAIGEAIMKAIKTQEVNSFVRRNKMFSIQEYF
jgi:hypothetical protein